MNTCRRSLIRPATSVIKLAFVALLSSACGGSASAPAALGKSAGATIAPPNTASSAAKSGDANANTNTNTNTNTKNLPAMITPSRLLPELSGERGVVAHENAYKRVLIDRMRLVVYEDGSLERATEILPSGVVYATELPSRLGGGFLFRASSGGSTQLWRASSWLSPLKPLVQLSMVAGDIIPGFDRLYVRFTGNHRLFALHPETGENVPLGPIPPSALYGALSFVDGWRAVIDTDLRGPLITFDAGSTWQPIDVQGRVSSVALVDGDPEIVTQSGRYRIDARGSVTFRSSADTTKSKDDDADDEGEPPTHPAGPLGKRPLRAAILNGFPDSASTAVVAQKGFLARVSLENGAVVASREKAFPEEEATCHATRLFAGHGFVCGERDGETNIYAFEAPLSMKPVMRFPTPRFIASSGNGALVIRGGCSDKNPAAPETKAYCILRADGKTREIHVRGEQLGYERVVALRDGREAVLVPPRAGNAGQLTILNGSAMSSVALTLPNSPRSAVRDLKNGMWLEGFQEREPGILGGWVEAGGPVIGVRVTLDGKVKLGEARLDPGGTLLSGPFALSLGDDGRAAESTDGGMTWRLFDIPDRDNEDEGAPLSRGCSPVGCAFEGWMRVGWGTPKVENDLELAPPPSSRYISTKPSLAVKADCELSGSVTPPLPPKAKAEPIKVTERPTSPFGYPGAYGRRRELVPQWIPFRNTPPPTLSSDEFGTDNGTPTDIVAMRAYVWGKKGADWGRVGRFMVRFDDRFDIGGGVRSSAPSASPWADEASAMDALGVTSYGLSWGAFLDPSGRAALIHACRSSGCGLFAASEGQSILPVRDAAGRVGLFMRPFAHSAVRVGEAWFFLTQGSSYDMVDIWRADLGVARKLGSYGRPTFNRYTSPEPVRLVRRAIGAGIGLLFSAAMDVSERSGYFYVIPVDSETGGLGEVVQLQRKDLEGRLPGRCGGGQDGWVFDFSPDASPVVDLNGGYAALDSVELRVRMDPGSVCVEGMAARMDGTFSKQGGAVAATGVKDVDGMGLYLAATERASGRRWVFKCTERGGLQ